VELVSGWDCKIKNKVGKNPEGFCVNLFPPIPYSMQRWRRKNEEKRGQMNAYISLYNEYFFGSLVK